MKRYFTLLMAAVMTLTILVTGCGSKNQETGPRTDLNVAMDCDADSLAPWDATLSTTLITRTILFDPLCYYDAQTTTVSYYSHFCVEQELQHMRILSLITV